MKIAKIVTICLSVLFIAIVVMEGIPGVCVSTEVPFERLMFGLFQISLLDDITHAMSGMFGILAVTLGYRWTVKYLMVVGGYYSLDALFFVTFGVLSGQPITSNLMLNAPHILISATIFFALRFSVKKIELAE